MLLSLPNLSAVTVQPVEDVLALKPRYPTLMVTKDQWRKWTVDPSTEHWFLSACEGVAANLRVSDDNPVFKVYGLVVDFDADLDWADVEKFTKKISEFRPAFVCLTFSNYCRLIFLFERPVLVSGNDHYAEFAKIAAKELKLHKFHGGFEISSLTDAAHYYDVGREWKKISDDRISKDVVELWAYEASKVATLCRSDYRVPLDEVKLEIDKRWPGRWSGDFVPGARGVRFWDPSADNETAAVVTPEGMICFTGGQAFVTWRDIFGPSFVQQFEAKKIADAINDIWYDGRVYWRLVGGFWVATTGEAYARKLRMDGFESKRTRGKTYSEVDAIEHAVQETRRVDAAAPFIYQPQGLVVYNNMRFLNTARAKCLEPVPESVRKPNPEFKDLEERCGTLIYPFLCEFFDGGVGVQLWHFLAWLKRAYTCGLLQEPKRGQATLLVGPASTGKTFMIQGIVARLLGGYGSGGNFLSGRSKWSADLAQCPLIVLDDDEGAGGDHRDVIAFTQRIKGIVANGELPFAQKFGAETQIEWLGRIIGACNFDPHAIARSLPDMALSVRNKINLFLMAANGFKGFRTLEENKAILTEELPWFGGWLVEWKPPQCTEEDGERRFGVKAYHHPKLLDEAGRQGYDDLIWNVICRMIEVRNEKIQVGGSKISPQYRADIVQFHSDLVSAHPAVMRDVKIQLLLRCLQSLEKKGRPVKRELKDGREIWIVSYVPTEPTDVPPLSDQE